MKNSRGIDIEITPFTSSDFLLKYVELRESLGGLLASGTAFFHYDSSSSDATENLLFTNVALLTITDDPVSGSGLCIDIPICIINRLFEETKFKIDFVCVDNPEFFVTRVSAIYEKGISDAIETVCSKFGYLDKRMDSDIDNSTILTQNYETCLQFCQRLCSSYKFNSVFGFSWNSLIIKDLIGVNSNNADENDIKNIPNIVGGGTDDFSNIMPYDLKYNRRLNYDILNPWTKESDNELYKNSVPENVAPVLGTDYYICRSGFDSMLRNYIQNTTLLEAGFKGGYIIAGSKIPSDYKLGDVVMYSRADESLVMSPTPQCSKAIVTSNKIYWYSDESTYLSPHTKTKFEWTTELRLIENGPWSTLSEQEINNPTSS